MATITVELERVLRVPAAETRAALLRSLRAQDFTITTEQVSMVGAKRGSQIAGSVQPRKLPVVLRASITPSSVGCTVTIEINDAWKSPVGKVWGMNGPYRSMMAEIESALDAALAPLASTTTAFSPAVVTTTTRDVPGLSAVNAGVLTGGGAVAEKLDDLLTPGDHRSTPKALKEVALRSSKGTASFDRMAFEGLLSVGLLVSTKPGSMPANLAGDVEAFAAKLEARVAAQPAGRVVCEVTDEEIPVAEFLGKQAAIRQELPLRTLHVCTTCKFEKIVNPDFEKLQEKNRRKQVFTGAVGATVSSAGIRPFLLVGSLLRLKNFAIPFVCPRCQGLEADSSIVTYCPNCGERRDEAVLRSCRRCKHNFGAALPGHEHDFWGPNEPEVMMSPFGAGAPLVPMGVPPVPMGAPVPMVASAPPVPVTVVTSLPAPALQPPATAVAASAGLPAPQTPTTSSPARWADDPSRRHQLRYWDGSRWTEHVSDQGRTSIDPL